MLKPNDRPDIPPAVPPHGAEEHPYRALIIKGSISGVLMGLANLVPGVSAGAVLLATGIFRAFITALSELAMFRWRLKPIVLLAFLGLGWVLAVLSCAGIVKQLVIDYRWIMYSLFIGLTLGGVPLVWKPADKRSRSMWTGAIIGALVMALLGGLQMSGVLGGQGHDHRSLVMLLIGGVLAAGATVLPGGSGTFVLLLMGMYVPLLGAVEAFKSGLLARDFGAMIAQAWVLGPFAIGMGVGLVSVSVVLKWTLSKFPQGTMGVLLGLLVGSVVGLWPFQVGVKPIAGEVVKGRVLTEAAAAALSADDWPVRFFVPTVSQIGIALMLIIAALGLTLLLARAERALGGDEHDAL